MSKQFAQDVPVAESRQYCGGSPSAVMPSKSAKGNEPVVSSQESEIRQASRQCPMEDGARCSGIAGRMGMSWKERLDLFNRSGHRL